jgi:predicted ArsR family transcriptional regulator
MERTEATRGAAPGSGDPLPLLRGTRGVVLRLLRGCELTADELATRLGVTPNAARFHLAELERSGLVTQRAVRRGPRKPSSGYSLTDRGEALFPKRYDALLNAVLRDLRAARPTGEVEALFRRLGRELAAAEAARFAGRSAGARVATALGVLGELGGAATAETDGARPGVTTIVGRSCPFGAVVAEHPEACALLEAFLTRVLPDAAVREVCQKGAAPHCRFEVVPDDAVAPGRAGRADR